MNNEDSEDNIKNRISKKEEKKINEKREESININKKPKLNISFKKSESKEKEKEKDGKLSVKKEIGEQVDFPENSQNNIEKEEIVSTKENNEFNNILNKKGESIIEKKPNIKFPQFSFKSNRRNKIETIDINENREIKENKLIISDEKKKPDNNINIFEDNNKKNIEIKNLKDNNNNTNTNNKNESIEKKSDKKDDLLFNPINIDDDEKDGVDDFDNLEEFII